MSCGPPLTLMKRTTLPVLTVSVAGSKAALLVPSPVIFTSTTAVGVAVAAAGAGAAFAVATAACEASPFFSPPQAATPNTASVLSTVQRIADLLRSLRCELVNAFTIYPPPSKAGALDPLRFSSLPTTLEPMPAPAFSQMRPEDLALRLDRGERVQLLDIRATERVAQVRVTFGPALDFRAVPASEIYRLSSLEPLHLDRAQPVAVICGHGNSSRQATQYLRDKGFEAFSVTGGMAAWETVHLPRALSPTPTLQHVIQLDRVGKGALSYVLISDGDAVVVDPGRYVERYDELLTVLGATAAAVIDTHMHADYLSGARAGAARWQVPYFLHPDDAGSPYDATPGRLAYQPLSEGDTIALAAPRCAPSTCPVTRSAAWRSSRTTRSHSPATSCSSNPSGARTWAARVPPGPSCCGTVSSGRAASGRASYSSSRRTTAPSRSGAPIAPWPRASTWSPRPTKRRRCKTARRSSAGSRTTPRSHPTAIAPSSSPIWGSWSSPTWTPSSSSSDRVSARSNRRQTSDVRHQEPA